MKSTRRIVAAGLAVATMFGTLGLAGCGSNSGSEQESNPKTIKIWHYEGRQRCTRQGVGQSHGNLREEDRSQGRV